MSGSRDLRRQKIDGTLGKSIIKSLLDTVKMSLCAPKMSINEYETDVRSCFKGSAENVWYGGTDGKIGDDPKKMYVAITEGPDWWLNKCILRDWFFDYEAFAKMPLEIDCEQYGVYVICCRRGDGCL